MHLHSNKNSNLFENTNIMDKVIISALGFAILPKIGQIMESPEAVGLAFTPNTESYISNVAYITILVSCANHAMLPCVRYIHSFSIGGHRHVLAV